MPEGALQGDRGRPAEGAVHSGGLVPCGVELLAGGGEQQSQQAGVPIGFVTAQRQSTSDVREQLARVVDHAFRGRRGQQLAVLLAEQAEADRGFP